MGVVVPVGFAQVRYQWTLVGDLDPMYVTFGMTCGVDTSAIELAQFCYEAATDSIAVGAAFSVGYTFGPTWVSANKGGDGPDVAEFGTAVAGAAANNPLPQNCAWLVRKVTGIGGRRHRGRFYFPAAYLSEFNISASGVIPPSDVTALQALADGLWANLNSGDEDMRLLHSDEVFVPTPITELRTDNVIATQRGRLRR